MSRTGVTFATFSIIMCTCCSFA